MDEQRNARIRRSALYGPLALTLLSVAAIIFMSLFFRVSVIQVVNDTVYTDEEILASSGLEKGVNLLFINNFSAVSSIYATMPYVESVSLKRSMPNKIVLEVTGSEAVACVSFGDDYWLINPNGKLLEKIDAKAAQNFIRVEHMEPLQPVAGEIMQVREMDAGKDVYLFELLNAFQKRGLSKKIDWVDLEDLNDPQFGYEERFTIHLNGMEETALRLTLAESAINQLASGDAGVLEVDSNAASYKVYFSPN